MTEQEGTQLLQSFSEAVAKLTERTSPAVVHVEAERSGGTGVVWSSDGMVVTANHVLADDDSAVVTLGDGTEFEAQVVGRDRYTDVALLRIGAGGLAPIERRGEGTLRPGEYALALARASGKALSVTSGTVTSSGANVRGWAGAAIEGAVVSDAKLNPGYSGGPLVDAWGRMVGMNVAFFSGRGLAVPVESLARVVEVLEKDGKVKKGLLGVVVEPIELPEEMVSLAGIDQRAGLLVRSVERGSPAKSAGVVIGDIIVRVGESAATDDYELRRALSGEAVGRSTSLLVLRGGKPTELTAVPREADENA